MSTIEIFNGTIPATDGVAGSVVYTNWVEVPESLNYMISGRGAGSVQVSINGEDWFAINSQPKSVTPIAIPAGSVSAAQIRDFPVRYMRLSSTSTVAWDTRVTVLAHGA